MQVIATEMFHYAGSGSVTYTQEASESKLGSHYTHF